MTTLRFGTLRVDTDPLHFWLERWKIQVRKSRLPRPEQALILDIDARVELDLMRHTCPSGVWSILSPRVDAQHRFRVTQSLHPIGFDAQGKPTQAASIALMDAYAQKGGFADHKALDAHLNKIYGDHSIPVPKAELLKLLGADKTFTVKVLVRYHVLRLKPRVPMPAGHVFLAVPYAVDFSGVPSFDCTRDMPMRETLEHTEHAEEVLVDPSDRRMRKSLKPLLEDRLRDAERWVLNLSEDLAHHKLENPWRLAKEDLTKFLKRHETWLDRAKRRLKGRKKRLKGY